MILSRRSEKIKKGYIWDWLEDERLQKKQCFTYPQIDPTLALLETVSSLDRKVPYLHGPSDSVVVLFTTKVGTKRFQVPSKAEFDLRDPSRPHPQYNFLHDNHLTNYLMNPCVKKRLLRKGLLTKEGDVKCTIKEFNEYRQWIRKLKLDVIEKEWRMSHAQIMDGMHSKTEEAELIKNNRDRFTKLYKIQLKKEISKKEKLISPMDESETDLKKKEKEVLLKQRQFKRNEENEKRRQKREELDDEDKRYRSRILKLSKKSIKMREEKMKNIYLEKSNEIKMKVVDLFKRRQTYFSDKMKGEKLVNINETRKRKKSLERRENVYKKQHTQIENVHEQYLNKNRDTALKHLHEATLYFLKMRKRRECQIHKWREHLKSVEKREHMLTYWRKLRSKLGKESKRRSDRRSTWDINQILLNQYSESSEDFKMEDEKPYLEQDEREESFQKDEREELYFKEECVYEKKGQRVTKDQYTETVFESITSSTPVDRSEFTGNKSLVSDLLFSRVEIERIRTVAIDIINAKLLTSIESLLNREVSQELSTDILRYAKNLAASSLIKAGENLGFDKNLIISTFGISPIEELTLKGLGNKDNLYQTPSDAKLEKVVSTKQSSLIGLLEVKSSFSLEVERFARHISTLTLIRAGASLGYNSLEIVDAFGIEFKAEDFLPEIEKINQLFVKDLVKKAMMQAAISLGYSQVEAELAVNSVHSLNNNLYVETFDFNEEALDNAEIASYAKNMAAVSLIKAGKSLGYEDLEIVSAFGIEVSGDLLKSIEHQKNDLISDIVNKALNHAALNLESRYSELDVSFNKHDQEDDKVLDADAKEINEYIINSKSLEQVSHNNTIKPKKYKFKTYVTNSKPKSSRLEIAKHMAAVSLIKAGVSLGFDHLELVSAFGIELSNDLISQIDERYEEFIRSMVKRAIIHAAVSLGYNTAEENTSLQSTKPTKIDSSPTFDKKNETIINKNYCGSTIINENYCSSAIISETLTAVDTSNKNQFIENSYNTFFSSSPCLEQLENSHQMENKLQPSISFQIEECAKNITSLSLIRASISLGYKGTEIASALDMGVFEQNLIFSIEKKYNLLVTKMVKDALKEAALGLGYTQEEAEVAIFNSPSSSDNYKHHKTRKTNNLKVLSCESINFSQEMLPCLSEINLSRVLKGNYTDKSPKKSRILPGIESFSNTFLTGAPNSVKPQRPSSEFPPSSTTSLVLPSLTASLTNAEYVSDITHPIFSPSSQLNVTKTHRHLLTSSDSLFMTEEPEVVLKNPADFEENKSLFKVNMRPLYLKKKDLRKTVSYHLTNTLRPKCFRFYSTGRLQQEAGCNEDAYKQFVNDNNFNASIHEKLYKSLDSQSSSIKSKSTFIQNPTILPIINSQYINKNKFNAPSPYKPHTNNLSRKAQSSSKLIRKFSDDPSFESHSSKPVSVSLNTGLRQVRRIEKGCNISLKNLISSNKKHVDSSAKHSKADSERKENERNCNATNVSSTIMKLEKPAAPSLNNFVDTKTEKNEMIENKLSLQSHQPYDGHMLKQSENKVNASKNKQQEPINNSDENNNHTTPKSSYNNLKRFSESKQNTIINNIRYSAQNVAANISTSNKIVSPELKLTPSPPLISKPHYLHSQSLKTMTNNKSFKELTKCKSLDSDKKFRNARVRPFSSHIDKESIIVNEINYNENRIKKKLLSKSSLTETSLLPQSNSRNKNDAHFTKLDDAEPVVRNSTTVLKSSSILPSSVEPLNLSISNVDTELSSTNEPIKTSNMTTEKFSSHEVKLNSIISNPDRAPYDNNLV